MCGSAGRVHSVWWRLSGVAEKKMEWKMSEPTKEQKMHKCEPTTQELRLILAEQGKLPVSEDRDRRIYAVRSRLRRRGEFVD